MNLGDIRVAVHCIKIRYLVQLLSQNLAIKIPSLLFTVC